MEYYKIVNTEFEVFDKIETIGQYLLIFWQIVWSIKYVELAKSSLCFHKPMFNPWMYRQLSLDYFDTEVKLI